MARNEEKARSLFSRWSALKANGGIGNQRRPVIASGKFTHLLTHSLVSFQLTLVKNPYLFRL